MIRRPQSRSRWSSDLETSNGNDKHRDEVAPLMISLPPRAPFIPAGFSLRVNGSSRAGGSHQAPSSGRSNLCAVRGAEEPHWRRAAEGSCPFSTCSLTTRGCETIVTVWIASEKFWKSLSFILFKMTVQHIQSWDMSVLECVTSTENISLLLNMNICGLVKLQGALL